MTSYRVVATDRAGFDAWRAAANASTGPGFPGAMKARMTATGETVLCWQGDDPANPVSFLWMCPGCGGTYGGNLGDQAVGGWDSPRWVNSGTPECPTLAPSLGCGNWRDGSCPGGHWWLRDGVLVPAA